MLLEKSGLEVVALVSDGASTNKTMYKTLGVSGKKTELKNFFENPYDETRKVFVLCDAPHTIKNIRNRLSQQKYLKIHPSQECISWDHYRYVLENDSKNMLKICPKISRHHIELNNLTKMKVKYATQVFSKSMAVGIQFYRAQMCYGLKNSLETQEFTLKMNNMFDAMNRKFPAEGIRKNNKDLEVLQESLNWLDQWETNLEKGLIQEKEFLTKNTSQSLRLTLKSTIDLTNLLLEKYGFNYVLTSKFNQDCLEKFFGVIRQSSGPNDHPSTPTFLQLYRLLSVYSLVKPPKSGNCTVFEDTDYAPLITISDLKNSVNENKAQREEKILKLKNHIDEIVEEGKWDMDDVFKDHDMSDNATFECVVYYLAGYLARRLCKKTKCTLCLSGIKTNDYNMTMDLPEAQLVNLKSRGFLTHPDNNFYILIRQIEISFSIHAKSKRF